jgi:hypothetical protein
VDPAVVHYDKSKLSKGDWSGVIRDAATGEPVSERHFTLPTYRDPFSLIFEQGTYRAELTGPGGEKRISSPFPATPPEETLIPWRE